MTRTSHLLAELASHLPGRLVLTMALAWATSMSASAQCTAYAGTLNGYKPSDCLQENGTAIGGIPNWDAVAPAGSTTIYLLAEGAGQVVQQVREIPIFDVLTEGAYSIHTLVYYPATFDPGTIVIGGMSVAEVAAFFVGGGGTICGDLDVTGTSVLVENPETGLLVATTPEACLNGTADIAAAHAGGLHAPQGYELLYLLVQAGDMIVQTASSPQFTVDAEGVYTIHLLVHDPATLDLAGLQPGTTTLAQINADLIQGGGGICAALDMAGATVEVVTCEVPCTADAGTLNGYKPSDCLRENGTAIGGIPNWDAVVPAGYATMYLLSEGPDQVVQQIREIPIFDVLVEGAYTIHTLVYDPSTFFLDDIVLGATTIAGLNAQFIAGGGSICASLDTVGTSILVENPETGTIVLGSPEACMDVGGAVLEAQSIDGQHVPQGYEVWYLVVQNGIILQVGSWPVFVVDALGTYALHTLVFDPATLDLAWLEPGVSTLIEVNAELIQGGGGICAALDMGGASIAVVACEEPCTAEAGTLTPFKPTDCLVGGAAAVGGIANGDAVVPVGFEVVYLLTVGNDHTIAATREIAIFDVEEEALYTVHTLVYDPVAFDVNAIVPGMSLAGLEAQLLASGSCFDLDLVGAQTLVENPHAGGVDAAVAEVCLEEGSATLAAVPDGNAHVPTGYEVLHVLSQGTDMLIIGMGDLPQFTVSDPGAYRIHTLVYNPVMLDLSGIESGVSLVADLEGMLVQAGGHDCAVLDTDGALFTVTECSASCDADAGSLVPLTFETCLEEGVAVVVAEANGDAFVPGGHMVLYLLSAGAEQAVVASGPDPVFTVTSENTYTVHTLVFDPSTFDPDGLPVVGSTVADVAALFVPGGGELCGALDATGATVLVMACGDLCFAYAGSLNGGGEVCLVEGMTTIQATPAGDANVPPGYTTTYLLSIGGGTIHGAGAQATFDISVLGSWTIHTMVHDPATWDPSAIVTGVTSTWDISDQLVQGGGAICGALDMVGATFTVTECGNGGQFAEDIDLTVWPVPTDDRLVIEVVRSGDHALGTSEVAVFNSRGAQVNGVRAIGLATGVWTIDATGLVAGVYTVRVTGPHGVLVRRFVKAAP